MNQVNSTSYKPYTTPHPRGFTLFYALLVTSLILALGLAVFNITLKELILSSDARESQNAFYAADAALECALYWDRSSAPAFGFYGDSLSSGLRGFWRMEQEADDTIAYDYSGNGNYGTLTGGASWTTGHSGEALQFNGTDSFVSIPDDPSLSFASNGLTIGAWVYIPNPLPANQRTIIRKDTQWSLGVFPAAGKVRALVQTAGGQGWNGAYMDIAYTFIPGNWYHLLFTYDGSNVQYYIDGETVVGGSKSVTGTIQDNGNPVYIGASENGGTPAHFFSGIIDEVRVYNRALSLAEVRKVYSGETNSQFVAPVSEGSGVFCGGSDMSIPENGWDTEDGWVVTEGDEAATTTFDIGFQNGRCASVVVAKDTSTTTIVSRGYNSCLPGDQRRVERALRAEY